MNIPHPDGLALKIQDALVDVEERWRASVKQVAQPDDNVLNEWRALAVLHVVAKRVGIEQLQAALSDITSCARDLPPHAKEKASTAVQRASAALDELNHYAQHPGLPDVDLPDDDDPTH